VSNVPGPRTPLYAQGHKVEAFHSMGIIADGFGLFIGGMSYHDQVDIGVLADKDALPDPFALADSIVEQLNLLLKAADEIAPPPAARDLPADPEHAPPAASAAAHEPVGPDPAESERIDPVPPEPATTARTKTTAPSVPAPRRARTARKPAAAKRTKAGADPGGKPVHTHGAEAGRT
jgi:hypothetical protein